MPSLPKEDIEEMKKEMFSAILNHIKKYGIPQTTDDMKDVVNEVFDITQRYRQVIEQTQKMLKNDQIKQTLSPEERDYLADLERVVKERESRGPWNAFPKEKITPAPEPIKPLQPKNLPYYPDQKQPTPEYLTYEPKNLNEAFDVLKKKKKKKPLPETI